MGATYISEATIRTDPPPPKDAKPVEMPLGLQKTMRSESNGLHGLSESAQAEPLRQLQHLADQIREARGIAHKRDIADVMQWLGDMADTRLAVPIGDDCAAIVDGDGYLLFAVEGFINEFVAAEPWFAGYCGVMVNVSDIYAMGGRPIAIVDALWSRGGDAAAPILQGLAAASRVYRVPVVGGHSNRRCDREQLSVAILGRATHLLSSFAARPGERLVAAIDLRGAFHEPFPYWDASSGAPAARLVGDLELMPMLAESGRCRAAKDISMAGIIGTALMFAECSNCGISINVDAIPRPPAVPLERWVTIFPSYGFLLSIAEDDLADVLQLFADRGVAAASIGRFESGRKVRLTRKDAVHEADISVDVWDFDQDTLMGLELQS